MNTNIILTDDIIKKRLEIINYTTSKKILVSRIKDVRERTISFINILLTGEITGIENSPYTNPMLWEFGHIVFFWEQKTIRHICKDIPLIMPVNVYDSFLIDRECRFNKDILYDVKLVYDTYISVTDEIIDYMLIKDNQLDYVSSYVIMLSILHNEMHCESLLYTSQLLGLRMPSNIRLSPSILQEPINIEYITIKGGYFTQGIDHNTKTDNFKFDNEMPSFNMKINDFIISKNFVTNYQYMLFIEDNGYNRKELWCNNGWRFIKENDIKSPLYWDMVDKRWNVRIWEDYIPLKLRYNHPVCHISWYEANAFCRWKNGRLITESEWEYIADNKEITDKSNLNYTGDTSKVSEDDIYGNVWEWCHEPLYPYDGFVIDPIYREMSYPFFGYKKICRGGSWACPEYLIHSKYRNAQDPDCRIQYIGFRVARDIIY